MNLTNSTASVPSYETLLASMTAMLERSRPKLPRPKPPTFLYLIKATLDETVRFLEAEGVRVEAAPEASTYVSDGLELFEREVGPDRWTVVLDRAALRAHDPLKAAREWEEARRGESSPIAGFSSRWLYLP